MTEIKEREIYNIEAIHDGWICASSYFHHAGFFIQGNGVVQEFQGKIFIDEKNDRFVVCDPQSSEELYVSGPEIDSGKKGRRLVREDEWSVSENDIFVGRLNKIRQNRDLKLKKPTTIYQAFVPRNFVEYVFDQPPCNQSIVLYSMSDGRMMTIKTLLKKPQPILSRDGTMIFLYSRNSAKYSSKTCLCDYYIMDNPLIQ